MKSKSLSRLLAATIVVTLCSGSSAPGADLYWNPLPLTGSWNTSATTWATTSGGSATAAWVNGAANNAIFDQAGPYTVTVAAPITAGKVTFSGSGTTTFTGTTPNLVTAATVQIDSGATLDLSNGDALFKSGTSSLVLNGTLVNGGTSGGRLIAVTGNGTLQGALRWASGSNFAGNIIDNGATRYGINCNGFSAGTVTLSGDNSGASGDFLVAANTLRLASTTALGTSYLRLEGGTAIVELAAGNLTRNASAVAGGSGINLTNSAGFSAINADRTVTLAGGAANGITWGTTAGFSPTTLLLGNANATHTVTLVNAVNLNAAVRAVQVTNGTATIGGELGGNLTGTGTSGLTKSGTGTLLLSGTNTYAGVTTISAGTLLAAKTVSLANFGTAGKVVLTNATASTLALRVGGTGEFSTTNVDSVLTNTTFNSGNSLGLDTTNSGGTFTYNTNITQTIGLVKSGAGTLVLGGNLSYNGATRIDGGTLEISGTTSSLSGNVSGTGNLVKSGSGTLTLAGTNSYSGTTTISAGTLIAKRTTQVALGTGAVSVASGANLTILDHAGGGQLAYANNLTLAGSGVSGGGALNFFNSGAFDMSGTVAISGGTTIRTDSNTQTSAITFTNEISGSGGLSLFAQGSSAAGIPRFALTGSSTYSGNTLLTSSGVNTTAFAVTLSGGNNRLPVATTVIFGGSPAGAPAGTFNKNTSLLLDGVSQEVAGLSVGQASANTNGYTVAGNSATTSTLVINNASTSSISGITLGSGTSGATNANNLGLTKTGAGTLTINGTSHSYTGNTLVNDGTLLVNGTVASSAFSVASGATLGGTGTIGGAVNVSGVLSPGASVGTLGSGTLSFTTGSTFAIDVDSTVAIGAGADLQQVTGALNLTGIVDLTLADLATAGTTTAFANNTVFSLINYTGAWNTGTFTYNGNALADGATFAAGLNIWQIDYNANTGGSNFTGEYLSGNFVNITAVPEPAALLLGSLGLLTLLRRKRN